MPADKAWNSSTLNIKTQKTVSLLKRRISLTGFLISQWWPKDSLTFKADQ